LEPNEPLEEPSLRYLIPPSRRTALCLVVEEATLSSPDRARLVAMAGADGRLCLLAIADAAGLRRRWSAQAAGRTSRGGGGPHPLEQALARLPRRCLLVPVMAPAAAPLWLGGVLGHRVWPLKETREGELPAHVAEMAAHHLNDAGRHDPVLAPWAL